MPQSSNDTLQMTLPSSPPTNSLNQVRFSLQMASKNTTSIVSLILENVAPVGNTLYDGPATDPTMIDGFQDANSTIAKL